MKLFASVPYLAAALALAGCAQQIYYKPGVTTAQVQRAQDACALQAQTAAPYRPETRIRPAPLIPEKQVCDAQGNCQIVPAQQGFPEFETVDANAERRVLLARTCMAEAGFDRVTLPTCDSAQRQSVAVGVTRTLPRISEASCIIPRGGDAYQIVTP
ncbi:hypothetical protein [Pseudooceanicola sp. MF1-13]|uniref:hypothetical protein n=1 Tax=Pseudooceanicola sp. MF1-13 TaxID=3379095 RepID=UPI003892178C